MADIIEKMREFAQGGCTFAGCGKLTAWNDGSTGMTFSMRIEDKDAEGVPAVHTHPFKGLYANKKDGTRFAIIAVMLGDDETISPPDEVIASSNPEEEGAPDGAIAQNRGDGSRPDVPSKRWNDLTVVQQAGIRCADKDFHKFLADNFPKIFNAALEDGKSVEDAAALLLRTRCGIHSRKELATNAEAREKFKKLDDAFHLWQQYPNGAER
jgi:hypothetical protein